MRILIVDDEPINRLLLEHIIRMFDSNIETVTAENGKESIDLVYKDNFDLIFMDVSMPIMDGATAIRHIRKNMNSDIKIVIVSAYNTKTYLEYYGEEHYDDYVQKPLQPMDKIHNLIKKYKK